MGKEHEEFQNSQETRQLLLHSHFVRSQDLLASLCLSLPIMLSLLYLNTVNVFSVSSLHTLPTQCLMLPDLVSLVTNCKFQNREPNGARQDLAWHLLAEMSVLVQICFPIEATPCGWRRGIRKNLWLTLIMVRGQSSSFLQNKWRRWEEGESAGIRISYQIRISTRKIILSLICFLNGPAGECILLRTEWSSLGRLVAELVKRPPLDFGSGHDLRVEGSSAM